MCCVQRLQRRAVRADGVRRLAERAVPAVYVVLGWQLPDGGVHDERQHAMRRVQPVPGHAVPVGCL